MRIVLFVGCQSCQSSVASSYCIGSFSHLLYSKYRLTSAIELSYQVLINFIFVIFPDYRHVSTSISLYLRCENLASRNRLFSNLRCFDVKNMEVSSDRKSFATKYLPQLINFYDFNLNSTQRWNNENLLKNLKRF